MANYADLKQAVTGVIKTNGNQEITGQLMQNTLLSIINEFATGRIYYGVIGKDDNPGTIDANVWFFAGEKGFYTNLGGIEIPDENLYIIYNTASGWVAQFIPALEELQKSLYTVGDNLLNKDETLDGYVVNTTNGYVRLLVNWWVSPFIEIEPNTEYWGDIRDWAFFDAQRKYISGSAVHVSHLTTPANAKYIRYSGYTPQNPINTAVFVKGGSAIPPYTPYVRIYKYMNNVITTDNITNGSVTVPKLDEKGQQVMNAFVLKVAYDALSVAVGATSVAPRGIGDISGWGGNFNKAGVSFNALRVPAGTSYYPTVPDNRKWSYAQVVVKNAKEDTEFIAKSPLMEIKGYETLPEIIYPLMTPDLTQLITLDDSSFTGSTYWINIYYYRDDMSFAYGGCVYGSMPNNAGMNVYYTTTNSITSWRNATGTPGIVFEHIQLTNPHIIQHLKELDAIQQQINQIKSLGLDLSLPNQINAIVGDTLQLFYRGIIKAVNPYIYDIVINCNVGRSFPRYFQLDATETGTQTFEIKVKDSSGNVIVSKSCPIVIKQAVKAPTTQKNVLIIGDSLTNARIYPVEAFRRLVKTGGTPAGLGYGNIDFVGRKKASVEGSIIGVEGNSGWSWRDYLTVGRKAFTFAITAPTIMPAVEAVYRDANNKTYTMWWDYSTTSVKMLVDDMVSTPPASGTLTKVSGTGDATITYSSAVQSSGNPFWNDATGALDVPGYVNKWCGGKLDIVYCLLTWNAQYGNRTDFSAFVNYAKTLFTHIHSHYPDAPIKLMGVQLPDLRHGEKVLGAPHENTYTDPYGLFVTALNMNTAYQDFANEAGYSDYVEFINVSSQVDSEFNMPFTEVAVNTRNSDYTDKVGTNDVHPNEKGYYQIADVLFRNFVANFCQ